MIEINQSKLFGELVQKHNLAVEQLTESQLAEALRQAIASGDFLRHVTVDGKQAITYAPYRDVEHWKSLYHECLSDFANRKPRNEAKQKSES